MRWLLLLLLPWYLELLWIARTCILCGWQTWRFRQYAAELLWREWRLWQLWCLWAEWWQCRGAWRLRYTDSVIRWENRRRERWELRKIWHRWWRWRHGRTLDGHVV